LGCARCGKPFCRNCLVQIGAERYCASCKEEQVRDLKSGTSGPQLASLGQRFTAAFVDGLLYMGLALVFGGLTGTFGARANPSGGAGVLLFYVVLPLSWSLYEGLFLQRNGQTLGKMAARIRVVNADGSEIRSGQAWRRALSRQLLAITQILGIVDILMIFSGGRKTLHDRFAQTIVIRQA
jgi:uncharacterized RDD family membrane protein YckC